MIIKQLLKIVILLEIAISTAFCDRAKAKALTKTTEIVTKMVADMQQIAADSDVRVALSEEQLKLSRQYFASMQAADRKGSQ